MRALVMFMLTALMSAALVALPAAAEGGITDPCGDADTRAFYNDDEVVAEESLGHVDIAGGGVAAALDGAGEAVTGITGDVTVCGEASASNGGYRLSWGVGQDTADTSCHQSLQWTLLVRSDVESGEISDAPRALFEEVCFHYEQGPLGSENETETIFRVELPADAYSFDDATLHFDIPNGLVPEGGTVPTVGDVFAHPSIISMDQTASAFTFGTGTDLGSWGAWVRTDWAYGPDVVLG